MNQRKMFRVPRNHNVVRRLDFGGEKDDQAKMDNFANRMKELEERDREAMKAKYNFDFKNEVALKGDWEWMKRIRDEWVLMEVKENLALNDNERTPIHSRDTAERVPPTRRRKLPRDDRGNSNNHVKKRLTME